MIYVAPTTSDSKLSSLCLRVTSNHPRRTPSSHLQNSLSIEPIPVVTHRLTENFFAHCPSDPNPPSPTNRELYSSHQTNLYKKYKHQRTKYILLLLAYRKSMCFFVHDFSLPLLAPIFIYILFSSTCTTV